MTLRLLALDSRLPQTHFSAFGPNHGEKSQSKAANGKDKTAEALASIHNSDKDPEIKRAVIQGFFLQGNAKLLIQKDASLQREAVQKLSLMQSKESTDFMMKLLNKP